MRAVIQRVTRASVTVDGRIAGGIGAGLLVLLGVGRADNPESAAYLAEKIANLRIFSDENGKMNLSLLGIGGSIVGGLIARLFSKPAPGSSFHAAGFIMSIIGALILLFIWTKLAPA